MIKPRWLVVVVLALLAVNCKKYDRLVEANATADQKWADYEAQLQRRYDMIPNLVAIVKGAAKYEAETLEKVVAARASATQIKLTAEDLEDPEKVAAFQKAQSELSGALSRLLVVNEQYPELKAVAGYRDLMVQIEGTENRILRAREEYNAAVKDFNTELGKVSGKVVNKVTGKPFKPRVYFSATDAAKTTVPKVEL